MKKIDIATCDDGTKKAAEVFYVRYCLNADNKNFRGDDCPPWSGLNSAVQSHWCAVATLSADAAIAVVREYADTVLSHMRSRPAMWASTKETFGAQCLLLTDLVLHTMPEMLSELPVSAELAPRLWGPGNTVPQEPCDDEWARNAVNTTMAYIEERWAKT